MKNGFSALHLRGDVAWKERASLCVCLDRLQIRIRKES